MTAKTNDKIDLASLGHSLIDSAKMMAGSDNIQCSGLSKQISATSAANQKRSAMYEKKGIQVTLCRTLRIETP